MRFHCHLRTSVADRLSQMIEGVPLSGENASPSL